MGLLVVVLPLWSVLDGQTRTTDSLASLGGAPLTDSAVLAAIAKGDSGKESLLINGGQEVFISGWGPVGRISVAAHVAQSRHHPFNIDSVTPTMRAPFIILTVRPEAWQVVRVDMRGRPSAGADVVTIKPLRVRGTPGSGRPFEVWFSTAVLSLDDLRIVVQTDHDEMDMLIGAAQRSELY